MLVKQFNVTQRKAVVSLEAKIIIIYLFYGKREHFYNSIFTWHVRALCVVHSRSNLRNQRAISSGVSSHKVAPPSVCTAYLATRDCCTRAGLMADARLVTFTYRLRSSVVSWSFRLFVSTTWGKRLNLVIWRTGVVWKCRLLPKV